MARGGPPLTRPFDINSIRGHALPARGRHRFGGRAGSTITVPGTNPSPDPKEEPLKQVELLRARPDPATASVHSSVRYSRRPPSLRQRCPRPQSARRMKRVSGRGGNARRKKRCGWLTPVAPTLRLQVRKQTPSPSSPRARATHGDRDSSGGSFRKLKRVQTRLAVQHWPRQLRAGPPTPAQIQEPALRCQRRSSAPRYEPRLPPFPTWRGRLVQIDTAAPRSPD